MSFFESLILGLLQGLTEFIPVSSSGHLELGKAILGVEFEENLTFTVVVHFATVLSTIVVFRKEIIGIIRALFFFKMNNETKFVLKIFVSMIPIMVVGLFFKEQAESFFNGNVIFVGLMLLVTGALLSLANFSKFKEKNISYFHAFIIGIAQAVAVLPGISRSGVTIATGLIIGNKKEEIAKFSFLMVLLPIIGANVLEFKDVMINFDNTQIMPIVVGFFAAFLAGIFACSWMIKMVKSGKLLYFAVYCFIVGIIAISSNWV